MKIALTKLRESPGTPYDSYFDVSLKKTVFFLNVSFFIAYLVIYTHRKRTVYDRILR